MKLTDPKYVWLTADTSHLTLGGMDPVAIIKEFWPRVAEIHYKDAPRHLRGSQGRGGAAHRRRMPAAMAGSAT